MNPGDGAEYIAVLSGFNLAFSLLLFSPSLCQHFGKSTTWTVCDRFPKHSGSWYCNSKTLLMKRKVLKSTFAMFSISFLTLAEQVNAQMWGVLQINLMCSHLLNSPLHQGVLQYVTFHVDICCNKVRSYIQTLTVLGLAAAPLAVTERLCCLFVSAEPDSLFICTLGLFWHDRSQWRKMFSALDPGGLCLLSDFIL